MVTTLFTNAAKIGKKARLRTLRDLDAAALQLRQAGGVLVNNAVDQLRAEGFDVRAEDVARLSPLGFDHINKLGRYAFIRRSPSHSPAVTQCEGA